MQFRLLGPLEVLTDDGSVDIGSGKLTIDGDRTLEVIGSGAARLGFTAGLLAAALEASVGPDVLLEITAQDRPVVVRSADQGTFTTLVMPGPAVTIAAATNANQLPCRARIVDGR